MSKKERASSDSTTQPQKASATADTSDVKSAVADPDEGNTEIKLDRKRKASMDEDLAAKKVAVKNPSYIRNMKC